MLAKRPFYPTHNRWRKYGWLVVILFLCIGFAGCTFVLTKLAHCSVSPWMKPNGDEVSPDEQLECTKEAQDKIKGSTITRDELVAKMESCMIERGYERRSWWQLNDMECKR